VALISFTDLGTKSQNIVMNLLMIQKSAT